MRRLPPVPLGSGIFVRNTVLSFQSLKDLSMTQLDISNLRKTLRQKRQSLTFEQQSLHAEQACQHLMSFDGIKNAKRIALFLSQDGELSTQSAIEALWQLEEIEVYLPALETVPDWHMGFSIYTPESRMVNNQFKILEPDVPNSEHISGRDLDLVIMPLVGFDPQGNRMGMGGGYYDRTFEFKLNRSAQKPLLIGWAHSCQQVESLPAQEWDVPLDGMITENGLTLWNESVRL